MLATGLQGHGFEIRRVYAKPTDEIMDVLSAPQVQIQTSLLSLIDHALNIYQNIFETKCVLNQLNNMLAARAKVFGPPP